MKLPIEFEKKMKELMMDEYEEFKNSFEKHRYYGLRVNTLKIAVEEFLKIYPFELERIKWTKDGFYYTKEQTPGKYPYYHAGLYYIQEPSAMFPGNVISAEPGEKILDLCAAPGGKSVQIAAGLQGQGILVSNDINSDRVKALVKNIELCGIKNAIVTNDTPEKLAECFEGYFDKILVDAPCSGEGMFRKDEDACKSWDKYKNEICSSMQWDILNSANKMLKYGGKIVYSTCTFSPEENEVMIDRFIKEYPEYELLEIQKYGGIESARPEWCGGNEQLEKAARLWPHKLKGEGHFVALLRKGVVDSNYREEKKIIKNYGNLTEEHIQLFEKFQQDSLNTQIEGYFEVRGKNLYVTFEKIPNLGGVKIAKYGLYLGEFKKNKFEPSHSLALALKKEDIKNVLSFNSDSQELLRYLKGETLLREEEKNGYVGILVDGYTVGWAKQQEYILKNLYPKGWRRMN